MSAFEGDVVQIDYRDDGTIKALHVVDVLRAIGLGDEEARAVLAILWCGSLSGSG